MTADEILASVESATVLRAGDVLLLKFSPRTTLAEAREAMDGLNLPDGIEVRAIGGSIEIHVLRPGGES